MSRATTLPTKGLARILGVAFGLVAVVCLAQGCTTHDDARPNVVLVSVDTLRNDALGIYGSPMVTAGFDRLAREGVLAEVAIAPAPETAPSHATLLTGAAVAEHGVTKNGIPLSSELPTLAEAFRDAGYATAGFVSSFVLDPRFGWQRGFDHYDAEMPEAGATFPKNRPMPDSFWLQHDFEGFDRRGAATTAAVLDWLKRAPEPFFLFVHYFDPHLPYVPPTEYAARVAATAFDLGGRSARNLTRAQLLDTVRRYHAEVLYVDAQLSLLVDALHRKGGAERTLVAVTSDHGEGLGQHHWLEHTVHLYDEQVRVPLVFHWPGSLPAEGRLLPPVGIVDVAPTLSDLAGVPFPRHGSGVSLAPALRSGEQPAERPIFGHRRHYARPRSGHRGEKFSVRTSRWKYIRATEDPDELYDLAVDMGELDNVISRRGDVAGELGAVLDAHLRAAPAPRPAPPLDDETRRGLEALGYVE